MANLPPEVQALTPDMTVAEREYQKATTTPSRAIHPGNIDLIGRPEIPNKGGMSTVYSFSFLDEKPSSKTYGQEVLVPLADEGRIFTEDEARDKYYRTGNHLGTFETPEEATAYAGRLHDDYASGKYATQRSIIRPETRSERFGGNMREHLGIVKKQPRVKMAAPFLGLDVDAPEGSDPVLKIGMMPDIGGKFTTGGRKLVGGRKIRERLYHGSNDTKDLVVSNDGVFGGVFASPSKDAARSHILGDEGAGGRIHTFDIPSEDILTQYALEYEVDSARVARSIKARIGTTGKDEYDAIYDIVVGDKSVFDSSLSNSRLEAIFRSEGMADVSFEAQRIRGEIAKDLGYKAIEMSDEHGTTYLLLPGNVPVDVTK